MTQSQLDPPPTPVFQVKATKHNHLLDCLVPGCGRKGDVTYPVWIGLTGILKGYYCPAHKHLVHGYRQLKRMQWSK